MAWKICIARIETRLKYIRRIESYRIFPSSDFVTKGVTRGGEEGTKGGENGSISVHTAVSFQFHENSNGILLFDGKLANTSRRI